MNKQQLIKTCFAVIIMILTIVSVLAHAHTYGGGQYRDVGLIQAPHGKTETELFKEILSTALYPYIQESVTGYYGENVFTPPYVVQVMEARRPTTDQVYELRLEVMPYTGAHIQVGIDHITLRISPEKITVVNFEHIKSFPLPPHINSVTR